MRRVFLVVSLISMASCGGGGSRSVSGPAPTPSPTPTPTPATTMTLTGTVSETAPTQSSHVAGATLTIVDGPDALLFRSATSDAQGVFHLDLSPGTFTIQARAANYEDGLKVITLTANQTVTLELDPVLQTVTTTRDDSISGGSACPGYWDYMHSNASPASASGSCSIDYVFNVHHQGTLNTALTSANHDVAFQMLLWRSSGGQTSGDGIPPRADGSFDVYAHRQYILQVYEFAQSGAAPPAGATPFRLTMTHPN